MPTHTLFGLRVFSNAAKPKSKSNISIIKPVFFTVLNAAQLAALQSGC